MKNELNVGGFTELTAAESELVDGGSIFSEVLSIVGNTIKGIAAPFPVVGLAVSGITDLVLTSIEAIASPLYSLIGWDFKGASPLFR